MQVSKTMGLVLAGGLSRRMGGQNKAFVELDGKAMIAHVIERAAPQVDTLVINANADPSLYQAFGLDLIADEVSGFAGPLAGIHTGMRHAEKAGYKWLVTFACDAPFVPLDFAATCLKTAEETNAEIVMAASNGRTHPVAGLWSVGLVESLQAFLAGGDRKVDLWTAGQATEIQDFPFGKGIDPNEPEKGLDPFFNINRPDDLKEAIAPTR
ncbi:MAG: molybdenum cofactor guanylyltransferase MobA [Alphaproteobacteria bacterium]